jgi:molybdenum cofactor biosynthesis protein B
MTPPGPVEEHKGLSPSAGSLRVGLVTASDSRTPDTNEGGRVLRRLIEEAGFAVGAEVLLAEEPAALREAVARLAGENDAVIVTGGTGIGPRDRTPEAVGALFDRRLPGFGELFRLLSFQDIGAAAMLSRADAGVIGRAIVFLLPGSPAAVDLAVRRLIAPELAHAVGQLRREAPHDPRNQHHHHRHGHHER